VCRDSPMFGWHNVEIAPALEYKLRLPVHLDNDVNALTLAKRHFGEGRGVPAFLLIGVGHGVGLGIVIGGEIYRGISGGAGEFGHTRVDYSADAPLCHCGRRGCLEAHVATYALVREAQQLDPERFSDGELSTLFAAAEAGDESVRAIFAHAGTILGNAVANLINIFDPALVVFSGEGLKAGDYLVTPTREAIQQGVFGGLRASIAIGEATEDLTWARGAASVMLDELFRPPLYATDQPLPIDELLEVKRPLRRRKRG
jgi:N-acetylglucosamine repressor